MDYNLRWVTGGVNNQNRRMVVNQVLKSWHKLSGIALSLCSHSVCMGVSALY